MSEKFDKFVKALDALCKEHDVFLTPSNYDILEVWDGGRQDAAGINLFRIDDLTRVTTPTSVFKIEDITNE